nr:PREDICTED: uncharacterized protein LOC109040357 [Bemisia tabaci]
MTVETSRKAAIKRVVGLAANLKSNVTGEFLEFVRVADESLRNLRRYFDAGKVLFDMNKGILNPGDPGFIAKTELLRNATFLKDELHRLAATYKTLEARIVDLPREHYEMMRPVILSIKLSEQALIPLGKKFQVDMDGIKPRPRTDTT